MRTGSAEWRGMENEKWRSKGAEALRLPKTPPPPTGPVEICDVRSWTDKMNSRTAQTILFYFNFFRPIVYTTLSSHRHVRHECKSFFIVTTRSTCRNMRVAQATAHHRNRRPLYAVAAGVYVLFGTNVKNRRKNAKEGVRTVVAEQRTF